jgi:hypothetical protein
MLSPPTHVYSTFRLRGTVSSSFGAMQPTLESSYEKAIATGSLVSG